MYRRIMERHLNKKARRSSHKNHIKGPTIEQVIAYKHDNIVGRFSCKGFDTFGPFKLIGGVSKGHPDEKDIAAAIEFYNGLTEQPVFLK